VENEAAVSDDITLWKQ